MPFTAFKRTSFRLGNKVFEHGALFAIALSLSLGITIRVSTSFLSLSMPIRARFILFSPSNLNGFVTTATVNAPLSLHSLAITGAAPVPVPPPFCGDKNHICAADPFSDFINAFSAACFPISGSAPCA
jgi:hypothetical protein